MNVLITVLENDHAIAHCTAECYEATDPLCTCICGGLCHGRGRDAAQSRIKRNLKQLMLYIQRIHPEATDVRIRMMRNVLHQLHRDAQRDRHHH